MFIGHALQLILETVYMLEREEIIKSNKAKTFICVKYTLDLDNIQYDQNYDNEAFFNACK